MSILTSDLEKQPSSNFLFGRKVIIAAVLLSLLAAGIIYGLRVSDGQNRAASTRSAATGLAAYKKGDFKEAVTSLEKATKDNLANAEAQRALGQSYEATGKLSEAAKAYQASLDVNPKQPEVLYNIALISKSQGKHKEAVQQLEKAVSINKEFIAARIILGDWYFQLGNKGKAKEQYRAVVDMNPFGTNLDDLKKKISQLE